MPYTTVKQHPYGSQLKHQIRIEVDDAPADPTGLAVYFIDPQANQTGPFTPTKISQGFYEYRRTYTSTPASSAQGLWTTFWRGTGAAEGAAIRQFMIQTIALTGPTI